MKKNVYQKINTWYYPPSNAVVQFLFLISLLLFNNFVGAQSIRVNGTENNINISKVNLSVGNSFIEQVNPSGNSNPVPTDVPVLIKSVVLEDGKELFVTTRQPEITNLHPVLGSDQVSESSIEIIRTNGPSVGHRDPEFIANLTEVVSTPDLRSYWSIGSQPSIPSGEGFVDLIYPFPSSGYILFSERNGNSSIDFIALGIDGKPIPGATTVQVRGYQWDTGVNHAIDNTTQKQWLVVFSPTLFNTLQPINGVRIVSINEPDGKLVFFVGSLSAAPDYAGPISNITESKAVLNIFDNDELNEAPVKPFDVELSVITPFPENTLIFNEDGTVDVPAGTAPGTYTMTYKITDKVGGESDQALISVRVFEMMPEANDDNVGNITNQGADAVVNVLDNDLINGQAATLENISLSEISNNTNGVLILNPNGTLDVTPGAQPGTYQLTYQICDITDNSKCDTAIVTVYLGVTKILAVDDDFGAYNQNGTIGNILLNDQLNGIPISPNQVDIVFTDNGGLTDLIVEENGIIRLPGKAVPGEYVLEYQLSETLNPTNNDVAKVRFTVKHNAITTINDFAETDPNVPIDIAVLNNDSSESGTFNLSTLNVTVPPANGTAKVNADGTINYLPSTNFTGEDSFTYIICDGIDESACSTAKVTVTINSFLMDLVKTVDKTNVTVGEMLTYTITVTNNSQFVVNDIMVEDPLPDNLTFVSGSPAPSSENSWVITRMARGESASITIEAIAVSKGEATNIATIEIADDQVIAEAPTVIIGPPPVDLKITKNSFGVEIYQGNEFTYEIMVENSGESDASDVIITDNLPTGLSYVNSSSTASSSEIEAVLSTTGGNVSWSIASFPAGETLAITLTVKADQIGAITNGIEVTTTEQTELTPEDNIAEDVNEVLGFFIPNVITPSARDNKNDQFEIKGIDRFATNRLIIFDRLGNHVFEADNYQNNWVADGLSSGSYFYVLELTDSNGKKQTFKGWVQVIKD